MDQAHRPKQIQLECDVSETRRLAEALKTASLSRSVSAVFSAEIDAPSYRRGSDGLTTAQWIFTVNVDLASCFWACAAVIIAIQPAVKFGAFKRVLRRIKDVKDLYTEITGKEPGVEVMPDDNSH